MAISEPILAFTLSRLHTRPAYDPGPAPPRDDEWDRRPQDGTAAEEIARMAALGKGLSETDFDYAAVPAENVAEINKLVSRIRATHRRHLEAVYEIGADLLRAKELLGHGNFLPWLQAEFRWSERTANNYMSIARFFQGKTANFADLDVGTAAALAAKSTPAEIRNELLERAVAGQSISREEVKERLAAGKEARRLAKAAAKIAEPCDAASIGESQARFAPPPAMIEHSNPEEFMRAAQPMRPIFSGSPLAGAEIGRAASNSEARKIIDAVLVIEWPMEHFHSCTPAQVAEMLLAAENEQELSRVQKIISFVLQIKQALDDKGDARREPDLRRAS
ncbi:MAG: DUF3102 domain-containing protein [Roseiarcus sp.]|jgi:hypothetical protein